MDVAIVERSPRPTGQPPRCRQCGVVVHKPDHHSGPALDRFCKRHHISSVRAELPLVAWQTGAPFRLLRWGTVRTERTQK